MPLPAVRCGDLTAHGTPLSPGPGSTNVFVGGMPAWRALQDTHVCPLVTPPATPHGTGMVTAGSTSVFFNALPAVRIGDQIVEPVGGANPIVNGCTSVNIG